MVTFADSFAHHDHRDESWPADSTRPFDDGFSGYDPRLPSQRFDSFSNFPADEAPVPHPAPETPSPPPIYVPGGGLSADPHDFSSSLQESNGKPFDGGALYGSVLPPPSDMQADEGFALREWRRLNAIRLQEKEKREKELLNQIIGEADEFKLELYQKRKVACEANKNTNREKEKLFLCSQEKFYAEADKNYWKAIAELIPNEVPAIAKKRGKKDREKEPSIAVLQGPKPGRPTDLSRMRRILVKLKHDAPPHLRPRAGKDDMGGGDGPAAAPLVAMVTPPKPVPAFS